MSRTRRCSETHVRDKGGNKIPVETAEVYLDGQWRQMARRAKYGVTAAQLRDLARSLPPEVSAIPVRVRAGAGYTQSVIDAAAPHRRIHHDEVVDPELARIAFLAETTGRRVSSSEAVHALVRLSLSLPSAELASFIAGPGAAPFITLVAQHPGIQARLNDLLGPLTILRMTATLSSDLEVIRPAGITYVSFRAGVSVTEESLDAIASWRATLEVDLAGQTRIPPFIAPEHPLVPQANSLANVCAVVDAVARGCASPVTIAEAVGMSPRQGNYYPAAAHALGLVVEASGAPPHDWTLTETGEQFVGLAAPGRVDYLLSALSQMPWVDQYTAAGPDALSAQWATENGLGPETIDRRLKSMEAWISFYVNTPRAEQEDIIARAMTGTRVRATGVAARHRPAAPAPVVKLRRCPKCHIRPAPAIHVCEECGTTIPD